MGDRLPFRRTNALLGNQQKRPDLQLGQLGLSSMRKSITLAMVLAISLFFPSIEAQAQINKCMINVTITHQNHPCPTGEAANGHTAQAPNPARPYGMTSRTETRPHPGLRHRLMRSTVTAAPTALK